MKKLKFILILLWLIICLSACSQDPTPKILTKFKEDITESISKRNRRGDSISTDLRLDTLFVKNLETKNYSLVFAQYHTSDSKLYLSILGIENFNNTNPPTFLLIDNRVKHHIIDSVKLVSDSVLVYCRSMVDTKQQKVKIGFDLKFDGTKFPWAID